MAPNSGWLIDPQRERIHLPSACRGVLPRESYHCFRRAHSFLGLPSMSNGFGREVSAAVTASTRNPRAISRTIALEANGGRQGVSSVAREALCPPLTGEAHGLTVRLHDILDLRRIAASHRGHDRDTGATTGGQDIGITLPESRQGESQTPQFIADVGVNPGQVPHHLRLKALQDGWQVRLQGREIGRIIRAIREFDVETALGFAEGVVFLAVQRAGEHARDHPQKWSRCHCPGARRNQ